MFVWKFLLSHFPRGKCTKFKSESPFIELGLYNESDFTGPIYSALSAKRKL